MATIRIKNLLLRTFIGFSKHELDKLQDVILNIEVEYDSQLAETTDVPENALDYKKTTKHIIDMVEHGRFNLIEALARQVMDAVMADVRVQSAKVEIDKPHALRFAESVSVSLHTVRHGK